MADIKQAAKWMIEGKEVKRESWGTSRVRLHVCTPYERVKDDLDRQAYLTAVELMADDWEIAE